MSDEGFLKRWSRRKRTEEPPAPGEGAEKAAPGPVAQSAEDAPRSPSQAASGKAVGADASPSAPQPEKGDEAPVDPATLPPLESLGADSDYRMFLKKGVPEALRIAALRKAWMTDPFIRDFRGPAEYALDYTTSEFDLRPTDDVAKMLDSIFPPKAPTPEAVAPDAPAPPKATEPPVADPASNLPQTQAVAVPAQPAPAATPAQPEPPRRKHGGALPD